MISSEKITIQKGSDLEVEMSVDSDISNYLSSGEIRRTNSGDPFISLTTRTESRKLIIKFKGEETQFWPVGQYIYSIKIYKGRKQILLTNYINVEP